MIFDLRTSEEGLQRCCEKQVLKPIHASIPPVLHLFFAGYKKYLMVLFLHESIMKFISI